MLLHLKVIQKQVAGPVGCSLSTLASGWPEGKKWSKLMLFKCAH